jgi:ABC-type lipoprotein release transport system permease subunit
MQTTTIQIAWRNLGRNIRRTALAILAITVGQFALLATDSLMRGYADNIRLAITGPMIGHVQAHAAEWRQERAIDLVIEDAESIVTQIQADPTVMNATARIYAPVLFAPEQDAFVAMVVGLQSNIESHEWGLLSGMTEPLQKGKVLIGHRLARKTGAKIGQEIAVVGQAADGTLANDLYVIQDIIKCPVDMVNQSGVVMSLEDAQQLLYMPNAAHEIVVRTNQSGQEKQLVERLQQMEGLNEAEVMSWQELVPELVVILNTSDWVGYFVIVIVCIAALAGIANTLVMSTFERMHEFGMLLALGSRPRRIVRMIMYEAILTGLLGVAAGTLLGYLFVWMTSSTGIDMASWGGSGGEVADMAYKGLNLPLHIYPRLEIFDALLGLVAILATSLVGSIWPAWIAGRLEPMEAMRA